MWFCIIFCDYPHGNLM